MILKGLFVEALNNDSELAKMSILVFAQDLIKQEQMYVLIVMSIFVYSTRILFFLDYPMDWY